LPLQGFDPFSQRFDPSGLPPLFRFVLLGQPFQGDRQPPLQIGHEVPS